MRSTARKWRARPARETTALVLVLLLALVPNALADRTQLKPGWNVFTPQQDVEIGQKVSADAERQLPIVHDARITDYLNRLGRRLAAKAPGERFPYQFKLVNDRSINAFALPGGFIYVHRGVIEAAENEAQLAGVIGHEIGHVAMRHGTNQVTKANFAQGVLGILGGMVGGGSIAAVAAQIGAGFAANSILLKYSRDAERQSDIIGTQILYDTGYDPRAMAQFFEKLQAESKGGRPIEFFSSHPNPENRVQLVSNEVEKLGGAPPNYRTDSNEFREIKRLVAGLPVPQKGKGSSSGTAPRQPTSRPGAPSERYQGFQSRTLTMSYPDNWYAYGPGGRSGQDLPVTLAPEGGIVQDSAGNGALAYGMMVSLTDPQANRRVQVTLESATQALLDELKRSNPQMQFRGQAQRIRIGREAAISVYFVNPSPVSDQEYGWVVTVLRSEGLYSFICVAPDVDFRLYENTFRDMLDTVRFRR